jgi:putative membrane protein
MNQRRSSWLVFDTNRRAYDRFVKYASCVSFSTSLEVLHFSRIHRQYDLLQFGRNERKLVMNKFHLKLLKLTIVLFPALCFAQQTSPNSWDGPGYWHMWGGWTMWWIFPFCMLLMMVVCAAIFFFAHRVGHDRWLSPWQMMGRGIGDTTHSALQILNERYARGEIQKAEYDEKRSTILSSAR